MIIQRLVLLGVAGVLAACGALPKPAPPPPGPTGVQRIAVQKPTNQTGEKLVVDDGGLLANPLDEKDSTVPETLAAALRSELVRRGFVVVSGTPSGTPTLQMDIRRWEPFPADYSTVTVDVAAALVESPGATRMWSVSRTDWKVPTTSAGSAPEAAKMAASVVARTLLDGWEPGSDSRSR